MFVAPYYSDAGCSAGFDKQPHIADNRRVAREAAKSGLLKNRLTEKEAFMNQIDSKKYSTDR
jgi:hypothetical protein